VTICDLKNRSSNNINDESLTVMASSFITKDDTQGFWIQDDLMQVVCWGLVNVIDALHSNDSNQWLKVDIREHMYDNSQGLFVGFMNLRLAEYLTDQERTRSFLSIIEKTKQFFCSCGDYISPDDLNSFQKISETRHIWITPLATERVIKILQYLDDLINEKIKTKDSDAIDYHF
jgi:hypothetical protein